MSPTRALVFSPARDLLPWKVAAWGFMLVWALT